MNKTAPISPGTSTETDTKRQIHLWCQPESPAGATSRRYKAHLFRTAAACERCGTSRHAVDRLKVRSKSSRLDATGTMHFALIKSRDYAAGTEQAVDAFAAAKRLLEVGFWPIWANTPGRVVVDTGDRVCVYLSGVSSVIATARIAKIEPWSREFSAAYPLVLGGVPEHVLSLTDVQYLERHVSVGRTIERLDCVGKNKRKWGTAFVGGMRTLTVHDYQVLTTPEPVVQQEVHALSSKGYSVNELTKKDMPEGVSAFRQIGDSIRLHIYQGCQPVYVLRGQGKGRQKEHQLIELDWFPPTWCIEELRGEGWVTLESGKSMSAAEAVAAAYARATELFPGQNLSHI